MIWLPSRKLPPAISPICADENGPVVRMRIDCALFVCVKVLPVTMFMVIGAFRTLIYGASLSKCLNIHFHTGDAANAILDHRSSGSTLIMAINSKGVVWTFSVGRSGCPRPRLR